MSVQQHRTIAIFISSPSDLRPEREALREMITDLNDDPELQQKYVFRAFLWEGISEDQIQGYTWQEYINLFGQNVTTSHVVIGMLWGRLGLELTNFVNPITGRPYRSGTEYELATANDAYRQHGLPRLLFYQCARTVSLSHTTDEARHQIGMVQEFIQEMQEEQMIPVPVPTFGDPRDLARKVRADLLRILPEIEQRLQLGEPESSLLPALPLDFVPRTEQLRPIIDSVCNNPVTLLHSIPGQGKTVMARAVCDQVISDFPNGVVWATFGQNADLVRIQREWILQLHGDLIQAHDISSAHEELIRCLQGKQILLVCDDVWHTANAEMILDNLPSTCHILITSRNANLLNDIPKIELGAMSSADSMELLRKASKGRVQDGGLLDEIAVRLRHLALALKIVGTRLTDHSWSEIQTQLASDRFSRFEAGQRNVFRSMDASVRFLPLDQQERYHELVIFPLDEPLVEVAVARLWQASANLSPEATHYLLTLFHSLSLVQSNMTLHGLQHDYLEATCREDDRMSWHNSLIASYGLPNQWNTLPDDGYSWRWFAWHLAQAKRNAELRALLLDATYLENKIYLLNTASLASDFALLSNDNKIALLARAVAFSQHVLSQKAEELPNQIMGRAGKDLISHMDNWPGWTTPHFRLTSQTLDQFGDDLVWTMPHSSSLNGCAFSPDSQYLLSASKNGMVQLWDAQTGEKLHVFQGHSGPVNACTFSPDGKYVLSASDDNTLRLWDVDSTQTLQVFQAHSSAKVGRFSPDRKYIFGVSYGGILQVWDAQTYEELPTFYEEHFASDVQTFSPNGRYMFGRMVFNPNGKYNDYGKLSPKSLELLDMQTYEYVHTFHENRYAADMRAFSPNGKLALSASIDHFLRIWEVSTGKLLHTLKGHIGFVLSCTFSPDNQYVLSASSGFSGLDETVRLWSVQTGKLLHIFEGHDGPVQACVFSPDGKYALSASDDRTLKLWEISITEPIQTPKEHMNKIYACAFSPDGQNAISTSGDNILVWDVATKEIIRTFFGNGDGLALNCMFARDGHSVVSTHYRGIRMWEVQTGKLLHTFHDYNDAVGVCKFSPDGRYILSASRRLSGERALDTTLRLWDAKQGSELLNFKGSELLNFKGHTNEIHDCVLSLDGRLALSASLDHTLRLWDVETGLCLSTLEGHTKAVDACAFSSDRKLALSASWDHTLRLWEVETGTCLHILEGHSHEVVACAFSPNDQLALSASSDSTLRLWHVQTGEILCILKGHTRRVTNCSFTPDGRYVVSTAEDRTLRLWNVETNKNMITWSADGRLIECMVLSPDGTNIVAGDSRGCIHFLTIEGVLRGTSPIQTSATQVGISVPLGSNDAKDVI